jgi:hypothetical protein
MTAATLTGSAGSAHADVLERYRDDGPLATAIGRAFGRRVALPPIALLGIAALPGLAAIVVRGDNAPRGVVAGAIAWAVLAGGLASGRPLTGPLAWTVPPALRAIEYGGLVWIAAVAGRSSLPAVFALLFALAFHHYDTVYGQRHRRLPPPRRLLAVAGGWDGRLLAAGAALLAGTLPAGFYAAAVVLGALFVGQAVAEWRRIGPAHGPGPADAALGEEDEEDEAG